MIKVRLMGTKNEIVWFQKILQRHPKVEVLEISELYSNKGTNKYYRAYAEVQKSNVKSSRYLIHQLLYFVYILLINVSGAVYPLCNLV